MNESGNRSVCTARSSSLPRLLEFQVYLALGLGEAWRHWRAMCAIFQAPKLVGHKNEFMEEIFTYEYDTKRLSSDGPSLDGRLKHTVRSTS